MSLDTGRKSASDTSTFEWFVRNTGQCFSAGPVAPQQTLPFSTLLEENCHTPKCSRRFRDLDGTKNQKADDSQGEDDHGDAQPASGGIGRRLVHTRTSS